MGFDDEGREVWIGGIGNKAPELRREEADRSVRAALCEMRIPGWTLGGGRAKVGGFWL